MAPFLPAPVPKLMTYQREISPRTTALAQRLARGTLRFSAIGRHMIEHVRHIGEWSYVPNGVPLSAYAFRARVDDDAPLAFLGRIEEIKGPHIAIEAARRAGRKIVLAGNVPAEHYAWFESHVKPRIDGRDVVYVGPVDDRQKNELLGRVGALLMPISWEEPFGIVMVEAMACGTPVIGFRRGAVPEVISDGMTGYIVDTIDEMTAAVGRLSRLKRRACRNRVERSFSDIAIADAYLEVYARMVPHVEAQKREQP
jgi:glycosyltransferase involved in cell wall biosynthesis